MTDIKTLHLKTEDPCTKNLAHAQEFFFTVLIPGKIELSREVFKSSPYNGELAYCDISTPSEEFFYSNPYDDLVSHFKICERLMVRLLYATEAVLYYREGGFIDDPFVILDLWEAVLGKVFQARERLPQVRVAELHDVLDDLWLSVEKSLLAFPSAADDHVQHQHYVIDYLKRAMRHVPTVNRINEELSEVNEEISQALLWSEGTSWLDRRVTAVISFLESDIQEKAKLLYEEGSESYHSFLTTSLNYVIDQVEGSDLSTVLWGDWIQERRRRIAEQATNQ